MEHILSVAHVGMVDTMLEHKPQGLLLEVRSLDQTLEDDPD